MWSFLSDLLSRPGSSHTIVVMDDEAVGRTRRYEVRPKGLVAAWGGSLCLVLLLGASLVAFTPIRTFIPGYGTEELRRNARLNALRVSALQDSVTVQRRYIQRLQQLLTGQVDSIAQRQRPSSREPGSEQEDLPRPTPDPQGVSPTNPERSSPADDDVRSHEQPAIAATSFPVSDQRGGRADEYVTPSLSLPVQAPVETGFPTRSFDARNAHYGIDLAVSEGSTVRAVGSGYVVLADWTQEGGYTVAVQHSDGYLSVYKHNKQLLKQTGDRVQAREALAVSGNSGQMTTGPHLHFELWRNGLAQDPRPYVAGW